MQSKDEMYHISLGLPSAPSYPYEQGQHLASKSLTEHAKCEASQSQNVVTEVSAEIYQVPNDPSLQLKVVLDYLDNRYHGTLMHSASY
jgi:hypothetical protein